MKHFIAGKSLRECAKQYELSLPTSFKWHHRILAALKSSQNQVVFEGLCSLPIPKRKDNAILIELLEKEEKELFKLKKVVFLKIKLW
jgi:hypothetical protein